ncbi:MAG: hypothetical protein F6K35_46160, partial [Okeania sp. SIO2H7]|nr:hypothetical protein [Okeania sp. SIO2H7]
ANRVFILGSNLLPFTYKNQKDWQLQQEYNVLYVALTRAKEELFLVPLNRWDVDDEESVKRGLAHPYGGIEFPQKTSAQEE